MDNSEQQDVMGGKRTQLVIVDPASEGKTVRELLESMLQETAQEPFPHPEDHLAVQMPPSQTTVVPYFTREPDRAVIEASLAPRTQWKESPSGILSYLSSYGIEVSVIAGTQSRSLDITAAREQIKKLGESTVLVARLLFLLWNTRYRQKLVGKNGMVPVLVAELLELMGIQKHTKEEKPYATSSVTKHYTDGFRAEHKKRVIRDVAMLTMLYVRATYIRDGLPTDITTRSAYLHADLVTNERSGTEVIVGFWINPGSWINSYEPPPEDPTDAAFARIEEAICKLNPQNHQHAIRLALNLIEQWRDAVALLRIAQQRGQPPSNVFGNPVTMSDLLASSMIPIDNDHVADRFAPRVEAALALLQDLHPETNLPIIGSAKPVIPIDKNQAQWGPVWKRTPWIILPPEDLLQACSVILALPQPRIAPKASGITKRTKRTSSKK